MKLVLNQPCIEPFNPAKDVRVFIACEDSIGAEQAREVLESIGSSCGPEGRLIYDSWGFEVLAIGSLRAFAGRDAATADLVVIIAHQADRLSQDLADWVGWWINLRKSEHGALAVMLDSEVVKDATDFPILSQLKESAAMRRMKFFIGTRIPYSTEHAFEPSQKTSPSVRRFEKQSSSSVMRLADAGTP